MLTRVEGCKYDSPAAVQEMPQLVDGGEEASQEALDEEFDLSEVLDVSVKPGGQASADRLAAVEAELQV